MKDNPVSSVVVDAIAQYSTSTHEQATVDSFLALHKIQFEPRDVQ